MEKAKKKILVLEPYFGGSHKQFLDGLAEHIQAEFVLLTLPARKWKMRMQLSAFWFFQKIEEMAHGGQLDTFQCVLCSSFVDVATMRAMLLKIEGWNRDTPFLIYFHENQFAYPNQQDTTMYQFTATNFSSAMACEKICFNSEYNRRTFLVGVEKYLSKATDMEVMFCIDQLKKKSSVIPPGIDYDFIVSTKANGKKVDKPVLVWNHRWEHDKGPEEFFSALAGLKEQDVPFKLIVMGQSFERQPACFEKAEKTFTDEILHFGFAEDYTKYIQLLKDGDIVVSTALHEFYGLSVMEAVAAGNYPILPADLSYPDIYPRRCLYEPGRLMENLRRVILQKLYLDVEGMEPIAYKAGWQNLQPAFSKWFSLH